MASSSNDGDAPKSSNQNSYNNKIFNNQSQKNIKTRSHKANPNEKSTMETANGNSSTKSKAAQAQEKTSHEEGKNRDVNCAEQKFFLTKILASNFRTNLDSQTASSRLHVGILRALSKLCRERVLQLRLELRRSTRRGRAERVERPIRN